VQLQPEAREAFAQLGEKPLGFDAMLESDDDDIAALASVCNDDPSAAPTCGADIGQNLPLLRRRTFHAKRHTRNGSGTFLDIHGARPDFMCSVRPPDGLINTVREAIARVDPTIAVTNLRTMRQQFHQNVATERFLAGASTAFAILATVLAGLGLYGVLAYSVAQRSREIGLRVALGAQAGRIRGMVLRQMAGMALVGLVLGPRRGSSAEPQKTSCSASSPATRFRSPRPRLWSRSSHLARPTCQLGTRRASIR